MQGWGRPSVFETFKLKLVALKPSVFPACYEYAMYPLTVILEDIWNQSRQQAQQGCPTSPTLVEFGSSIERALVYGTTGSPRVLNRRVMGPLLLARGIVANGYPALDANIWKAVYPSSHCTLDITSWPQSMMDGCSQPSHSAMANLIYHYNGVYAQVRLIYQAIHPIKQCI